MRRPSTITLELINQLHDDGKQCAALIGLLYANDSEPGLTRLKKGKGFSYVDAKNQAIKDKLLLEKIAHLAIPPAWKNVWICPNENGHILVTGEDEKGRKQYIYHPKWRTMRDLLNFYRLIVFGESLPALRTYTEKQLKRRALDHERILAAMLRIIDSTYIRVGNETYVDQNESFGLSTLTKRHVVISDNVVTLSFKGKSGKDWFIEIDDPLVTRVITELKQQNGPRLFKDPSGPILANDVNKKILELAGVHITAKDFRTWGGTLAAFRYLKNKLNSPIKDEKLVVQAAEKAAEALGNTRTVAKAHYVHPHILETFTEHTFETYLKQSKPETKRHLDKREQELLGFLKTLFKNEFKLIQI